MIRVLCREVLLTLAVLAALAGAAAVLRVACGLPTWPHWSLLLHGDPTAVGAALRLAGYAVLGLCALAVLTQLVAGWIVLRQLQIPVLTHVAEAIHVHQVLAMAGALRLMLALVGAKETAAAATASVYARGTPRTLVHTPPALHPRARQAVPAPDRTPRPTRHGARPVRRPGRGSARRVVRLVPALLYTVQRGDTLSLIAERLYGDPAQYTRIVRASRDIRQDDGGMLEKTNLIRPGWRLRVPLPVLHLSVRGDHALYVVQPGDAESVIAARFLGDWRRYVEIDRLSRGVLQPDGGRLENPNLIQPGWILRLPLAGRLEPAPLPLRLKRHIVPRRAVRAHRHAVAPTARTVVARALRHPQTPASHPPRPEPPAVHVVQQRPLHQERHHQEDVLRPVRAMRHLQPLPPAHSAQRTVSRRVRPKRQVHPRRLHAQDGPGGVGVRPAVVAAHPLVPGTCPPPGPSPVAVAPVVRLPDSDRLLPLALVLGLLSLCALLARYHAAGRLARAALAGQRVVPSMQRALLAAQAGALGLLERRLRRAAATTRGHGNVVAHVVAALAAAGRQTGAPVNLARLTRRVTESQQAVSVLVEVRRLTDDLLAQVMAALQTTLGTPVQVERASASGGLPCVRLTLKRAGLAVRAEGWGPGQGRPHPAPLLVPVGHAEGTVVHLNLGRCGAALVVGGTQGATTLVATLLAGSVIQAHPRELRLLVASADDELRGILPVLEHLEAPPADAGDVAAMAALVDQAYGVVVERFTAGEDEPGGPAYLLVLDQVETLRANRRALDRLDVICRNGHLCDVHVLATTAAPVLLEEEGLLASFPTRLLRRLGPEESALLCGDARATTLDVRELLVQAGDQALEHLSLFTLTVPEVRDLCARLATLLAAEAAGRGPVSAPQADAGVEAATTPPEVDTPATALAPAAAPDMATAPMACAGTANPATTPTGAAPDRGAEAALPGQPAAAAGEAPAARLASGSAVEDAPAPEEVDHRAAPADGDGRLPTRLAVPCSRAAPPALPIAVTVFGQISASVGETEIALEGQHRRVLAALAIMGPKRVRAERLYNALFPDLPDEQANRLLITTISALRHRVRKAAGLRKTHDPDPILRDATGYGLNPALVRVDSYAFQELLARSDEATPEEQGDLLAQAVDLYRGDLCGDQEMEWLIDVIPAWRRQYLEALAALATYYADFAGDLAQAERTARRLVDDEPTVMPYTHLLMRVRAALNDESGVQKAYHAHRQALIALEMDDEAGGALAGLDEESLWDTEELCERLCREIRDRRTQGQKASKAG